MRTHVRGRGWIMVGRKRQPSPGLRRRRSLFGGKSRSVRESTTFLFGNGPILEQSFPFVLCGIHAGQCSMLILCGPPAKQRNRASSGLGSVVQPRLSEDQDSGKISTGMVRFRWSSVEKRVKHRTLLDLSTPFPQFGGSERRTRGFSIPKAELAELS